MLLFESPLLSQPTVNLINRCPEINQPLNECRCLVLWGKLLPFAMLVYWSATEQYGHTNHVTYKSSFGFHKSLVQPKYSCNLWTDFPYSRHIEKSEGTGGNWSLRCHYGVTIYLVLPLVRIEIG